MSDVGLIGQDFLFLTLFPNFMKLKNHHGRLAMLDFTSLEMRQLNENRLGLDRLLVGVQVRFAP